MFTLLARHRVEDFDAWMAAYAAQRGQLAALGITREAGLRSVADGNDVIVLHEFETQEAAETFIAMTQQADMQEMLKAAGVVGPVTFEVFANH
ncbi:MAG: hypothetical protein NWR60_07965 [Candidatus Nanopelagicales bacterium]|jgi:hypothetical protein|nr:hypothetical protein [Candidatus Nanopelagicales bacterium]